MFLQRNVRKELEKISCILLPIDYKKYLPILVHSFDISKTQSPAALFQSCHTMQFNIALVSTYLPNLAHCQQSGKASDEIKV